MSKERNGMLSTNKNKEDMIGKIVWMFDHPVVVKEQIKYGFVHSINTINDRTIWIIPFSIESASRYLFSFSEKGSYWDYVDSNE